MSFETGLKQLRRCAMMEQMCCSRSMGTRLAKAWRPRWARMRFWPRLMGYPLSQSRSRVYPDCVVVEEIRRKKGRRAAGRTLEAAAVPCITFLVCDEDALGQHDVNANVSIHELSNAYVARYAGQHISLVVAQMLL